MTEHDRQVWVTGEKPKTEQEWLAFADPLPVLSFLGYILYPAVWPGFRTDQTRLVDALRRRGGSERVMRLFACACCRTVWHTITDKRGRESVEVAERFADGLSSKYELSRAHEAAEAAAKTLQGCHDWDTAFAAAEASVQRQPYQPSISVGEWYAMTPFWGIVAGRIVEPFLPFDAVPLTTTVCNLLRDALGNPFRPVVVESLWLTSDVLALARQMYDARDFSAMPIFADALQDAGCDNHDILNHCRSDGPHVRGCWVVDLILGKGSGIEATT